MRVLFVNPFFYNRSALERQFMTFYFPLGLLYLAASARHAGHHVGVFDGTFSQGDQDFIKSMEAFEPEVVCIGSWITVQPSALHLAALAAERGITVVIGGPGPTADPSAYLHQASVDVLVLGEGERTLVELLAALASDHPLSGVNGLAFSDPAGELFRTSKRELIHELDSLPFPARDLIDVERYLKMWQSEHGYRSLTIAMSRGCPDDHCPHCADAVMGPNLRVRSIENIISEMGQLQENYSLGRFRMVDDLNRFREKWLRELGEAMMAAGVTINYEGLNTVTHEDLPMLAQTRDICHERNAWIPTQGKHGHAPPTADTNLLRRRWEQALLLDDEHLEDP